MKKHPKKLNAHRIWLAIFGIWAIFLSGAFSGIFGGPGVIQAVELRQLLDARIARTHKLQDRLTQLNSEAQQLQNNPVAQRREIRQVLGYAAPDELIFDFHSGSSL